MTDYLIAYFGGDQPATQEEGAQQMEKWKAWLSGMGDAVVNPGTPLNGTKTVTASSVEDNQDKNRMTGFTVVKADSMESVLDMAKNCPVLEIGGFLDVSEMINMQF